MKLKRFITVTAVVAAVTLNLAVAAPVTAGQAKNNLLRADSSSAKTIEAKDLPPTVRVVAPFDHAITVDQAMELARVRAVPIVGVRVENPTAEAEYTITPDLDPLGFTNWFEAEFGVSPLAAGWIKDIDRPVNSDGTLASIPDEPTVTTGLPIASATPTNSSSSADQLQSQLGSALADRSGERAHETKAFTANGTGVGWRPNTVEVDIEPASATTLQFRTYAYWGNGNSPRNVADGFGLEFQVDLFNNAVGTRGPLGSGCGANFKDAFIAKNYSYPAWGVTTGRTDLKSAVSAYADYNDLYDGCNRNSMSIGMRYPQNIPTFSTGKYTVLVTILASRGNTSSSRLGANIQQVDDDACRVSPPSLPLTDCMGVAESKPPGGDREASRPVLNQERKWVAAPSRCWVSNAFGVGSPVPTIPPPASNDGCFHL